MLGAKSFAHKGLSCVRPPSKPFRSLAQNDHLHMVRRMFHEKRKDLVPRFPMAAQRRRRDE